MAKSFYEKQRNKLSKTLNKINSDTTGSNKMQNQISNYQTRLKGANIDPSNATDKRNPLEKALNLPEDQNFLFDIFEIIGRPQQALFGAIQNAQEGKDILEGAGKGISGEQEYYFGDILRNWGVDDTELFKNPLTGKSTSLADIGGLVGDILADPVDLALFAATPATGGASAGALAAKKGAEAVDIAADASKAVKAAKAVDTATDVAKAAKVADDVADTTKYVYKFNPLKAMTQKESKSLLEMGASKLAGGTKKLVKGGDKLLSKGLSKLDDKTYYNAIRQLGVDNGLIDISKVKNLSKTQLDDVAENLSKIGVDVDKYANNLTDLYQGTKKGIRNTVDYAKSVPDNLVNKINRTENAIDSSVNQSRKIMEDITKRADDYAITAGKNVDDVLDDVNLLISSKYAPETSGYKFLNKVIDDGKATLKFDTPEELNSFVNGFKKLNKDDLLVDDVLKFRITDNGTTLSLKSSKGLKNIVENNANRSILENIKHIDKTKLSPNTAARVAELDNLYKTDSAFKTLVDESSKSYDAVDNLLSEATGKQISYRDMLREGYTRNTLTNEGSAYMKELDRKKIGLGKDEINIGSKATTSGKKYSNVAEEADKQLHENIVRQAEKKSKKLDNLKDYNAKVEDLEQKIATKKAEKIELAKAYDDNVAKLNLDKETKQNFKKIADANLDNLKDDIKATMKKASISNIDDNIPTKYIDKANKYTDSLDEFQKISIKLNNPNLTDDELKKVYNELKDAEAKVLKNQQDLYKEKARIDGAILKKETKNINKAVNASVDSSSKFTKQQLRYKSQVDALDRKLKKVEEGYNKINRSLDKQINNMGLELDKLKNMTPEEIKKFNDNMIKEAEKLQKDISFLKSGEGIKFYETSYDKNLGDFINVTAKDAKDINRYNEILLHSGLNNEEVMKFIPKGEKAGKIPPGYVRLNQQDAHTMLNFLENKKNFLPNEGKDLIKEFTEKLNNSGAVVMDKDAYSMLKLNLSEKEVRPLVRMIDGFNNTFKKYKVFTPGFHLRNISGNATNMVMSGVPVRELPGLYSKANKLTDTKYITDLFSKKLAGNLTDAEKLDLDMINKFMQGGFLGKGKEIQDLGAVVDKAAKNVNKSELGKLVDKVFTGNMNLNEWVDNRNRMALLLYADKNPKYLSKLGASDSIAAVKKVLFDPNNLSPFEKNTLKRIVPFYTFTKQNLIFHADNIMKNTTKYKRLVKTFDETYDSLPKDTYRQYQKENMQISLFRDSKGNVSTLKTNLPVSDLGEYLENPLQRLVSSSSPLIKAPFEAVTGKDVFTGQDLYKPGADQLASWLGVDSLTTAQIDKIGKLFDDIGGDATLTKTMSDLLPSVMQYADSEKIASQNQYQELLEYQEYVKQLKNQGIDVPTIKELTSATNSSIKSIKNYRKRRSR